MKLDNQNKSNMPRVVIVGRVNVGKSTLFNRFSESVRSLIYNEPGVTRDSISDTIGWKDKRFELVDSGGIFLKKQQDSILSSVQKKVLDLIDCADIILFMCDGVVGPLLEDQAVSKLLHKKKKNTFLIINKCDVKRTEEVKHEFEKLGWKKIFYVSSQHGIGTGDILDEIVETLPQKDAKAECVEPGYSVTILGKPNVGKSTLMNLLIQQERSLVTDVAGTTREAITENVRFYKENITLTDTPGIRRKRSIKEPLETMMVKSSFGALFDADIVLLMMDGSEGRLSDQELKLAFYAFEQNKALILLINKIDLMEDLQKEKIKLDLLEYDHLFGKVPILWISSKTEKGTGQILPLVKKVWGNFSQELTEYDVNDIIKTALRSKPLYHKTMPLKVLKAISIKSAPPTILLSVNEAKWFGPSQLAFFEKILRKSFKLDGCPVKFIVRKNSKKRK